MAWSPLVAKELLKTKHPRPRSQFSGTVAMGGPDEAYDYWEHHSKFWAKTPGAMGWLRETLRARTRGILAQTASQRLEQLCLSTLLKTLPATSKTPLKTQENQTSTDAKSAKENRRGRKNW